MLTINEKNRVQHFVKEKLSHDTTGHSIDHIERVVRLTEYIVTQEKDADVDVCYLAAYLHDVIDDKVVSDVTLAKQQVEVLLQSLSISESQIQEIMTIIDTMSFSKQLEATYHYSLNAQIVQDADRLDAIGAIGIARTFLYAGAKGSVLYDATIPPREKLSKERYRHEKSTALNHFYEKLLLLKDGMHTQTAKQLAKSRHDYLEKYVKQFLDEWYLRFD